MVVIVPNRKTVMATGRRPLQTDADITISGCGASSASTGHSEVTDRPVLREVTGFPLRFRFTFRLASQADLGGSNFRISSERTPFGDCITNCDLHQRRTASGFICTLAARLLQVAAFNVPLVLLKVALNAYSLSLAFLVPCIRCEPESLSG